MNGLVPFVAANKKDSTSEFQLPEKLGAPPIISAIERSRMTNLEELIRTSNGKPIKLPASGAWLNKRITLATPLHIIGEGNKLLVSSPAEIRVMQAASLRIEDTEIYLESEGKATPDTKAFIQLNGREFGLRNNTIHNLLPSQSSSRTNFDQHHIIDTSFWLVDAPDDGKPKQLAIENNQLFSYQPYSAGGIRALGKVSGTIARNNFEYLHSALRFPKAQSLAIKNNRFLMASYGAINIGGTFNIADNKILYPGGGIVGDGITINDAKDAVVDNNLIFGGTCYGIWVKADNVDGLTIANNTISSGITSGINISALNPEKYIIQNIVIHDNVFAGNAGFGVSVSEGKDVVIKDNMFHNNASDYQGEIFYTSVVKAEISGNMQSVPTDFDWSKKINFYRTHVNTTVSDKHLVLIPDHE